MAVSACARQSESFNCTRLLFCTSNAIDRLHLIHSSPHLSPPRTTFPTYFQAETTPFFMRNHETSPEIAPLSAASRALELDP